MMTWDLVVSIFLYDESILILSAYSIYCSCPIVLCAIKAGVQNASRIDANEVATFMLNVFSAFCFCVWSHLILVMKMLFQ